MKSILAPTDFSKTSHNAVDYAVEIAKLSNAKLILFHVFHVPVIATEVPVIMPSLNDLEKDCLATLSKIKKTILSHNSNLIIDCVCKCGFAVDEINLFTKNNHVDLIVLGMQGANYLSEKLMGSITTSIISKSKCPVLAIAQPVKFKSIKKIVLACDYLEAKNKSILEPLKEFAKLFNSHIYILNISNEPETVLIHDDQTLKAKAFANLGYSLENTNHSFHNQQNDDVVDGINDFIIKQKMDMVVMIPRTHSLLTNIFHEPKTKRLAFNTDIPLLALHD